MKRFLVIASLLVALSAISQTTPDTYIRVDGTVLSAEDSSKIESTSLSYEKLPYYDKMGIAKSKVDGKFEFYLLQGQTYSFSLKSTGFEDKTLDVVIEDNDGDGVMPFEVFITPIEKEPEPELITLENLIFARGSDRISQASYQGLDELVLWLDERSTMVIQLEGHTDFAGNADANMRLSQARVEAVKEYLVDKGVKKNRVLTKAFGGTQPLSQDRTDEAKKRNRRVEVRVISR